MDNELKTCYCNKCNEEVKLEKGCCPKCGTNWKKIIEATATLEEENSIYFQNKVDQSEISQNKKEIIHDKESNDVELFISDNDIKSNIRFFLVWGTIVLVLFIFAGIIGFIAVLSSARHADDAILPALGILVGSIISGIIFNNILKWFAYMLYTNQNKIK